MKSRIVAPLLGLLFVAAGCAGVPVEHRVEKGLLQGGAVITRVPARSGVFSGEFIWPVKQGQITSLYGSRRRDFHEGIDIRARKGSPVFAAKAGRVIYSARRIHGYGNMVVVRHSDGTSTVYAHNKRNIVHRGQLVTQGQQIAEVGSSGKSTGPHVHFEIRRGELPQDPLLYLPQVRSMESGVAKSVPMNVATRRPSSESENAN